MSPLHVTTCPTRPKDGLYKCRHADNSAATIALGSQFQEYADRITVDYEEDDDNDDDDNLACAIRARRRRRSVGGKRRERVCGASPTGATRHAWKRIDRGYPFSAPCSFSYNPDFFTPPLLGIPLVY